MGGLEAEVPLVKSHVARFGAMATIRGLVTLTELSEPFEGGVHYPLFLLCLQHMHKIKGESWLVDTFNNSKLDLQKMLPGGLNMQWFLDSWTFGSVVIFFFHEL